jgi:hypothetical protein
MKLTILISVSFLIVLQYSYSQEQIPRKANLIVISDTISQHKYYSEITDILFENGYGIHNSNEETGTITTTDKSFRHGNIRLTFLIKNNRVLLRGQFNMNLSINYGGVSSDAGWVGIEYYGMKKSPAMTAWDEMYLIAKSIPGIRECLVK